MKTNVTKSLTIFGHEIGKITIETEFAGPTLSKERGIPWNGGPREIKINTDDITPVLVEALKRTGNLISDNISFFDGNELVVEGNTDSYTACQNLKNILQTPMNVFRAVSGVAALTNARNPENIGPLGLFNHKLADVIAENWEPQEP